MAEAGRTVLRGFTTVRDVGDPFFGLKRASDEGSVPGPRVYPSGSLISQIPGHCDFSQPYTTPPSLGGPRSRYEQIEAFVVVDGVPEMTASRAPAAWTRRQPDQAGAQRWRRAGLRPIDILRLTPDEIQAAVQIANDWGTSVATHVYTNPGVRRAIESGVRSIEHA